MPLFKRIATADVNAVSLKATAGRLYLLVASNLTASAKFVKLYNKTSAPTVGTDVPVLTFPVQANQTVTLYSDSPDGGLPFSAGVAFAMTGAVGDADATALAAGDMVINGRYE